MRSISKRVEPARNTGTKELHSKYIFAFEGYRTEVRYFEGLMNHRGIAGIRDLINICVLQREEIDCGCSDPLSVVENTREYIKSMDSGYYTVPAIMELVKNQLCLKQKWERNDIRVREFSEKLTEELLKYTDSEGFLRNTFRATELCNGVTKTNLDVTISYDIPELETYDREIDHVCVIVDRDRSAHTVARMNEFVSACKNEGFEPFICNPCFEFWLMLHFEGVLKIDKKLLLANEMTEGHRFTETELERLINGVNPDNHYDKTDLDPLVYLHRIGEAVRNSRYYCEELKCLNSQVGTNLGKLFGKICKPHR